MAEEMNMALDEALAPLRELFDSKAKTEKQAKLQEMRQVDEEKLKSENDKAKAIVEAKCIQLQQQYDVDYRIWQDRVHELKAQSKAWKTQSLCPHCGESMGLFRFFVSCKECKKKASEQLPLPLEPQEPQLPTFIPNKLDESNYILKDYESYVRSGEKPRVTIAGIDWVILDVQGKKVLLIAEKVLEKRPYHQYRRNDITWESCTLRRYLNDEFYNKLGVVKDAVAETRNSNPNNLWYGTNGGNVTIDKVFLLSLDELVKYFGDSGKFRSKSTDGEVYDEHNVARIAKDSRGEARMWWLRSPGEHMFNFKDGFGSGAAGVKYGGAVDVYGNGVDYDDSYIRPALWLNL